MTWTKIKAIGPARKGRVNRLLERDGNTCHYCGIEFVMLKRSDNGQPHPRAPTLDHKVPKALGGDNSIDNMVLSCHHCNQMKGPLTDTEYKALLEAGNNKDERKAMLREAHVSLAGKKNDELEG